MFCYDIASPKRLNKVSKALEKVGLRIQKSFFQCEMNLEQRDFVKRLILHELNLKEDSFIIYQICTKCAGQIIKDGKGDLISLESFQIL